MIVDQLKLIGVMKDVSGGVSLRYPGYKEDLFEFLAGIVMLEREHEKRATAIQKKVSDRVAALGLLIQKKGLDSL